MYQVGIDKFNVPSSQAPESAKKLAKLMKIDEAAFVKQVKAAAPKAFVPAITVRQADLPDGVEKIKGGRVITTQAMLAPDSTFAAGILGAMGAPTP